MPSVDEINKQFEDAGLSELKDDRNTGVLSGKLKDNEIIEMASIARKEIKDGDIVAEMNYGLLLATNIRALYINKGVMWGCSFEEFDYSKINSIEQDKGSHTTTITISASDKSYEVTIHNDFHKNHTERIVNAISKKIAQVSEKYLNYHKAIEFYDKIGELEESARIREIITEQKAVKVTQKVVHGDEITKTEIKDSVLNRSNVGGGSSKMQELKDLTEMKKEGLINDDEFQNMKNEILGVEIHERKKKVIKKKHPSRTVTVECPDCGNEIKVSQKEGTQKVTCSNCGLSGEV